MATKTELLALLTEAARKGSVDALATIMWQLKKLAVPTAEVMSAINIGSTRARLGL